MRDFVDGTAFNNEQGNRARKLFAAVVLAALDDAIADDKNTATAQSKSLVGPAHAMAVKFCLVLVLIQTSAL